MMICDINNPFINKKNIYINYYLIKKSTGYKIAEVKKDLEVDKVYNLPKTPYSLAPLGVSNKAVSKERQQLLKPVESFEEYECLLNSILEYKVPDNVSYSTKFISTEGYKNVPVELLGLVSYCGCCDKSDEINRWLSGRPSTESTLSDEEMANVIRCLDYSLEKLDEKYGKYEGIVYRTGFFNPNTDNQFYSSSLASKFVTSYCRNIQDADCNSVLSIIKVKNGHKICDFQQDTNSKISKRFARREEEILIDRKSKFRKIPKEEYTEKDKELVRKLCEKLPKSIEDYVWKHIDIWTEI